MCDREINPGIDERSEPLESFYVPTSLCDEIWTNVVRPASHPVGIAQLPIGILLTVPDLNLLYLSAFNLQI